MRDYRSKYEWVMKIVPPWIGFCCGWFAAIACYVWLDQGLLVFAALPAIGLLSGIWVGKRIKSPYE